MALYLKYQLASYGYARLTQFFREHPDYIFHDELRRFLEATVSSESPDPQSHFYYATLLADEKRYLDAVRQFQMAARSPLLRSSAQRKAAECFSELRLNTAATSAWRQSREQHLDDAARNVLFMLARSYEDCGDWKAAAKIYEMVLSWDADFRNSWDKLNVARSFFSGVNLGRDGGTKDYTGVTVSLLGPDAPRDIEESLTGVIKARSREALIQTGDRQRVQSAVKHLLADEVFSSGIRRDIAQLGYDLQMFMKYDFGLPEDEMKKFLETVNAHPHFEKQRHRGAPRSLDVGSATGRYPLLLAQLGFQAYGLDIEEKAIDYSRRKTKRV